MTRLRNSLAFKSLRWIKRLAEELVWRAMVEGAWFLRCYDHAHRHRLNGHLVLSLTSYRGRFGTLALTLKSLLVQTAKPDAFILWVSKEDLPHLPANVLALRRYGLLISECADLRSYKKIIPALIAYPNSFIVTADDDLFYWSTWLEELVRAHCIANGDVVCHRAHRVKLDASGRPAAYEMWENNIGACAPSPLVFPTSGGGVLYWPGMLHKDVLSVDQLLALCPTADDIWLYWMAARTGVRFRKIGRRRRLRVWRRSQDSALYNVNVGGERANDTQVRNMIGEYGWPPGQSK